MPTSIFVPVDPDTAAMIEGKEVRTSEDFAGFMYWLTLDSAKELRGRAYAAIDGSEPTLLAKAELIDRACGDYVTDLLGASNKAAAIGLGRHSDEEERAEAEAVVAASRGELRDLCEAIQAELFTGQMRKAAMSGEAIDRLIGAFDGQNRLAKSVAVVLADAARDLGSDDGAKLPQAMRSFLESKDRRGDIKRAGGEMDPGAEAQLGIFAPLIKYIEDISLPKAKAEMLAHLEDYVRSGWFFEDMVKRSTGPNCALGQWWGATHDQADALRDVLDKVERGEPVAPDVVGGIFQRRVAELALGVKTAQGPAPRGAARGAAAPWVVKELRALDGRRVFSTVAAPGEVDSCWISPDSTRCLVTCATSSDTLSEQGDQMARYRAALSGAFAEGMLGHLAVPAGSSIAVEARTLALCSAQAQGPRDAGRQAGVSMLGCFEKGSAADERSLVAHLNALPYVALLAQNKESFPPASYAEYGFDLFGERESLWKSAIDAGRRQSPDHPAQAGSLAMASFLGSIGECMGRQPLRELTMSSNSGGIGRKAHAMLSNILTLTYRVSAQAEASSPAAKRAIERELSRGVGPLLRSLEGMNAAQSDAEAMQGLAVIRLRALQKKIQKSIKAKIDADSGDGKSKKSKSP